MTLVKRPGRPANAQGVGRSTWRALCRWRGGDEAGRWCDLFIGCAAVADYRPAQVASQKIKKSGDNDQMALTLVKNPGIIADVGALSDKPFTVGFAAETVDVEQYALDKLRRKRLDMIAANGVSRAGQGFNADDNAPDRLLAGVKLHCPGR